MRKQQKKGLLLLRMYVLFHFSAKDVLGGVGIWSLPGKIQVLFPSEGCGLRRVGIGRNFVRKAAGNGGDDMKDRVFEVLQRIGRSFMLPIAILPAAGLLLGLGSSFTNETTITAYHLKWLLGPGTVLHALFLLMNEVGSAIFDNLPLIFAVGVAIGMAKKEKEAAALAALIAFFVMHVSINGMLLLNGIITEDGSIAGNVLEGTITSVCGIWTLQMGVFGGILVGLGTAALHNRFYQIRLPDVISFFGGTRFVPIIATLVYLLVGIAMYFIWPVVQGGIYAVGSLVTGTGYFGTLIFGVVKRALIPFGLHHVFYMPFWQTAVGGTMEVGGKLVQGGQNIFFAQLANASNITHFSADATRYFSGEFLFMIFGLPGAALAMYQTARPERKKQVGSLLLSASFASILTGITEPLEFSFLFTAPVLFGVQVVLAGSAYMVAHLLNIAVGLTFSGGLIDLILFGVLPGNQKTGWLLLLPVGIIYFLLYYGIFRVLIERLDLKTPGREVDTETQLYTKKDVTEKKTGKKNGVDRSVPQRGFDEQKRDNPEKESGASVSERIVCGLGGKENIENIDCCATRLRCSVSEPEMVKEDILRASGASGVIVRGRGVQIIYGPQVTRIKSALEEYLDGLGEETESERSLAKQGSEEYQEEFEENAGMQKIICSPMTGRVIPLEQVCDEVFAEKLIGDGVAVIPEEPYVYAPEDGEVTLLYPTGHAVGMRLDNGTDLLIHVGIDTVKLGGAGFETLVAQGQRVVKGTQLLKLDLPYLIKHARSMESPVLCVSLEAGQEVRLLKTGTVEAGEALYELLCVR